MLPIHIQLILGIHCECANCFTCGETKPETMQHQRHCNTRDIATPVNSPASSDLINHSIDRFHYCTRGTHTGSDPHNYTPTRHQHCSLHCLPHTRKPICDIFSSNKLESTICITLTCYICKHSTAHGLLLLCRKQTTCAVAVVAMQPL